MTGGNGSLLFLGSGGGRGALIGGLRRTGGLLLRHRGSSLVLDPGLGTMASLHEAGVDLRSLDGVVLSHFHLDHVAEANVLIEGMTLAAAPRGLLAAPAQALEGEGRVIYRYRRPHLSRLVTLAEGEPFHVGSIEVVPAVAYSHHNAATFRFRFRMGKASVAFFGDGASLAGARRLAGADLAVLNCLLPIPVPGIDHLDPGRAAEILLLARPRRAYLTHFSASAISRGLTEEMAAKVQADTGVPCLAATDMLEVGV